MLKLSSKITVRELVIFLDRRLVLSCAFKSVPIKITKSDMKAHLSILNQGEGKVEDGTIVQHRGKFYFSSGIFYRLFNESQAQPGSG